MRDQRTRSGKEPQKLHVPSEAIKGLCASSKAFQAYGGECGNEIYSSPLTAFPVTFERAVMLSRCIRRDMSEDPVTRFGISTNKVHSLRLLIGGVGGGNE